MDAPINKDLTNMTLNKQYKLTKKLGSGAFGEIYLALKSKEEYAVKLERVNCKFPQVFFEAKLYNYLQGSSNQDFGIPKVVGAFCEGDFNYMVMEVLGKSLEDLYIAQNRKFSLKTTLMLADQMLQRIEFIHSKSFIHRDIKPDNFLMGAGQKTSRLYIVDFGLAKRYITNNGHIPYKENKSLTGTVRYASINTHLGVEQSRRDDLEGLGYVLIYLCKGSLPWMNLRVPNQQDKYKAIMDKKMNTPNELLCKGLPNEFVAFMNHVKQLKFEEKPDYQYLRSLFRDVAKKQNFEFDYRYDWTKPNEKIMTQTQDNMYKERASGPKIVIPPRQVQGKDSPHINGQSPPPNYNTPGLVAQTPDRLILQSSPKMEGPGAQKKETPVASPQLMANKKVEKGARPHSSTNPKAPNPPPPPPVGATRQQRISSAQKRVSLQSSAFQKQVAAPRIVINKEPYQKF